MTPTPERKGKSDDDRVNESGIQETSATLVKRGELGECHVHRRGH